MTQVWHYGLMAEYWARFMTDAPEAPFFIESRGASASRCSTWVRHGRILLPLLRAGLDADGCDVSPDMLRWAKEAARREGFDASLVAQAMHELDCHGAIARS
jgi:hypothetical protein